MSSLSSNAVLNTLFIIAPQYYTTDQAQIDNLYAMIGLVIGQVNANALGCQAVLAAAFLTAAYLTLQSNPNLGVYGDMTEGQLHLGFNVDANIQFLNLNPYGRAYLDLIRRTGVVGGIVSNIPVVLGGVWSAVPVQCGCQGQGFGPWGNS